MAKLIDLGRDKDGFTKGFSWPLKEKAARDRDGIECYEWLLNLPGGGALLLFRAYPTYNTELKYVNAGMDPVSMTPIVWAVLMEEVEVWPLVPCEYPEITEWRPKAQRQLEPGEVAKLDRGLLVEIAECKGCGNIGDDCEYKVDNDCKVGVCKGRIEGVRLAATCAPLRVASASGKPCP